MGIYTEQLHRHLQAIECALPTYLPTTDGRAGVTAEAMHYACEGGGKRLRPVLVLEWMRLCGGDPQDALAFACALEMIHSYSLVHDDLPCMDNSPMRRGKPSAHAAYGETMALLAGDGLLNRAFEVCLDPANTAALKPENVLKAAHTLAVAAGYEGMIGGQTIDLANEGKRIDVDTLRELHRKKTGALLIAACQLGAQLADTDADTVNTAVEYGAHLGLAFQIVDDILDATATAEQLGKPVGADEQNEKTTYVSLFGLDGAIEMAKEETAAATTALDAFGDRAADLRTLTAELLTRIS
ncbi:MAG: polyprenyl synthetase family protein [Clostridia bacterium]|nr:polyprenyl synthetase family protein [Clostridia bacterium]